MLEEQRSIKHATTLFANRVFYITTDADEVGPQIPEERRLWQVQRLLRFPKCMLGLSTWKKLVKLEHQCNEAYQAYRNRLSAPVNAPPVQLKHMHFTQRIADLGWFVLQGRQSIRKRNPQARKITRTRSQ